MRSEDPRGPEILSQPLKPATNFLLVPGISALNIRVKNGANYAEDLPFTPPGKDYSQPYAAKILAFKDGRVQPQELTPGNLAIIPTLEDGERIDFSHGDEIITVYKKDGQYRVVMPSATIDRELVHLNFKKPSDSESDTGYPSIITVGNGTAYFAITTSRYADEAVLVMENLNPDNSPITIKPDQNTYSRIMQEPDTIFRGFEIDRLREAEGRKRYLDKAVWSGPFVTAHGRPPENIPDTSHHMHAQRFDPNQPESTVLPLRTEETQGVAPYTSPSKEIYAALASRGIYPVGIDRGVNRHAVWQPRPDAVIVVDDTDPQQNILNTRYNEFKAGLEGSSNILDIMGAVGNFVRATMPYNKMGRDNLINARFVPPAQDSIVPLATYVKAQSGTEREMTIYAAYLLERLTKEGILRGQVSLDTNSVPTSRESSQHNMWVRCTNEYGNVFILDFSLDKSQMNTVNMLVAPLSVAQQSLQWNYARPGKEQAQYPVTIPSPTLSTKSDLTLEQLLNR